MIMLAMLLFYIGVMVAAYWLHGVVIKYVEHVCGHDVYDHHKMTYLDC